MGRNIGIKFLSWTYMYTTIKFLGKHVIQTNPSKFDERLFSNIRERERFSLTFEWFRVEKFLGA